MKCSAQSMLWRSGIIWCFWLYGASGYESWCTPLIFVLQAVLQYHPGLEFLADTPEFQARYAETVIYRIFYTVNRCGSCPGVVCGGGGESRGVTLASANTPLCHQNKTRSEALNRTQGVWSMG